MECQQKKSFASTQNMLKSALNGMSKYSKHARRGFLVIVQDNTGLHRFGTKNLVDRFLESKSCANCVILQSWEDAAREDTKNLNSEEAEEAFNAAPAAVDGPDILANLYQVNDVPKLPFAVEIMSEKEAGAWLLPELKKDLVENGSKPVNRINWGDEKFHPKCWADEIVPWHKVSNICHPQKIKLDVPICEALKASIKKRLKQKNIDPNQHIDEKADPIKAKRKKMVRGIHKSNNVEVVDPMENESIGADAVIREEITSIELSVGVEPEVFENVVEDAEIETEIITASSEAFDQSFERQDGGFGRRVLPSRPAEPAPASPTPVSDVLQADMEPQASTSSPSVSPTSTRRESPVVNLLPPAKRLRTILRNPESSWSKGRGKGGKNLRVTRGRITSDESKDREKEIKVLWKQWLKGYIEETKEIIKTNPKGRHIACEDCSKEVSKSSFLTHRTVNGCPNLNPRIKLYNWI